MIAVSWFRRAVSFLAGVTLLVGATSGCDHACSTVYWCFDGLQISFDGKFQTGTTYDLAVKEITPLSEVFLFAECSMTVASDGTPQLFCNSGSSHAEVGNVLQFPKDYEFRHIVVAVSTGGVDIGEQAFEVDYVTKGDAACGTCTNGFISVTIP